MNARNPGLAEIVALGPGLVAKQALGPVSEIDDDLDHAIGKQFLALVVGHETGKMHHGGDTVAEMGAGLV
ncbi:hypothetical protein D3C72_2228970 [compost metagenome]